MTKKEVEKFIALVNGGSNYRAAAKEFGRHIDTVKRHVARHGYEMPKRLEVPDRVKPFEDQILNGSISQHQVAKNLGVSQCAVSNAYRELGYRAFPSGGRRSELKQSLAQEVVEYIQKHGGYVTPTIRKLGLNVSRFTVTDYAKRHGIDLTHYQFAYLEFGLWQTQPGPWKKCYTADYRIPCLCRGCGEIYQRQLVNLRGGYSRGCRNCVGKHRGSFSVICKETKEKFRSIRAWIKSIGRLKEYQAIRHNLQRDGFYIHSGTRYELINKSQPASAPA